MKKSVLKEGSKLPLFLSALVFPGLGQLVQKRWMLGCFFLGAFTLSFLVFAVLLVILLVRYYEIGFDFFHFEEHPLHFRGLIVTFLVSMGLYAWNVVDAAVAQFRATRPEPPVPAAENRSGETPVEEP